MRPDDLNTALRVDLVLIAGKALELASSFTALLARIEAALPISELPQPAPFPTVQNEGVGIQGKDQRAQKSGVATSEAGAAPAGHLRADPRNSSRSTGEAASVSSPVDRTPFPEQPASALPPRAVKAEPPAASSSQPAPQEAPKPYLIARADVEREPPVQGFAKPAPAVPFTPADIAPLMGIGHRADANITEFEIVGIDPAGRIIRGPLNDWTTDAPTMRTIQRMNHREALFDKKTLADAGPWPGVEAFERRIPMMKRHLAAIGVDFTDLKGAGCRIRRWWNDALRA